MTDPIRIRTFQAAARIFREHPEARFLLSERAIKAGDGKLLATCDARCAEHLRHKLDWVANGTYVLPEGAR